MIKELSIIDVCLDMAVEVFGHGSYNITDKNEYIELAGVNGGKVSIVSASTIELYIYLDDLRNNRLELQPVQGLSFTYKKQ